METEENSPSLLAAEHHQCGTAAAGGGKSSVTAWLCLGQIHAEIGLWDSLSLSAYAARYPPSGRTGAKQAACGSRVEAHVGVRGGTPLSLRRRAAGSPRAALTPEAELWPGGLCRQAAVGAPRLSPRGRLVLGVPSCPRKPAQGEIVPLETCVFC